jgi:hypothetical protein
MSRLDQHIETVRNKLALGVFLEAWAWTMMGLGVAVLMAVLVERVLDRELAHAGMILLGGLAVSLLGAFIYSMVRRPTVYGAALRIDEVLGLKEKYSTALYARLQNDPFAQASVLDAERSSEDVSLYKRFPLAFPKQWLATAAIFVAAMLVALLMPPLQWFSKPALAQNKVIATSGSPRQDQFVKQALPTILAPATMPSASDQIKLASAELNKAMSTDEGDDLRNHRSLLSALQDYNKTMVDELKKNEKFQTAMEDQNELSSIPTAKDDSTPIGKAQNELKSGNLDEAMNDISAAVNNFNKMSPADQMKMVNQAKLLAQTLANSANDPKTVQRVAQQMMQMGASQSQAQQMAAAMQQAAQGNPQAQQQMQQVMKQMTQQMNNGQGPTQQQQQQIQSMMAKAQAMMNSQAQAQALSSAAQQLGVAMAQARAAQQQSSPGQQSHPGQSQGGQSGQSGQGQGMAAAQQQMQQQLQQMQANAQDAQAMQAAANAAAQSAAEAASGLNGPNGGNSSGDDASGGTGQNQNRPNGTGAGGNGKWGPNPGKGGSKMGIAMAPATFKQEMDPSRDIESGKILASRYVKAGIDPGKSNAGLRDAAASAEKDAPDDIDQDHVPREAQQAEKDYFSAMQAQDGN